MQLSVTPTYTHTGGTSERAALGVFVIFLAIAAWALLFHLGSYFWFHGDEWDFLVERDASKLGDLLRAHGEHLTLLPILVYRFLWSLFGIRSYFPYQVPVVLLHLIAAVLLRIIMRRSGVNPWIATSAASILVLFGPGAENIIWAFQITFAGSLVFGLAQLLLADHAGPGGSRDWCALGVGLLGLLCSGFAPLPVAVVGAVVLVRRGWRPALFQTAPLAVVFLSWWLLVGPDRIPDPYGRAADAGEIIHFVCTGIVATLTGLGGSGVIGALFGAALLAGLVVAWLPLPREERLRQAIMPLSLLIAGIAFLFLAGYGRWWIGDQVGSSSRYVHVFAAFTLPALAVAFDALARRWRFGVPAAAILLAVGIPHNIGQFDSIQPFGAESFEGRRELITALAQSPYALQVPRSTRVDPLWSNINVGWLLDARAAGKLPESANPANTRNRNFKLRFGIAFLQQPAPGNCTVIREPVDMLLNKGDEFGVEVGPWTKPKDGWFFMQSYTLQLMEDGKPVGQPLLIHPSYGNLLRAQFDDLNVRIGLAPGTEALKLCH